MTRLDWNATVKSIERRLVLGTVLSALGLAGYVGGLYLGWVRHAYHGGFGLLVISVGVQTTGNWIGEHAQKRYDRLKEARR